MNLDIIAGSDWLRQLKKAIDWDSSVLMVLRNSVNYKVYLSNTDSRMKDLIFMNIMETNES